ncbi:MAG: trypsin-like peptidase domain-containing protein [Clostridia bacterium]|nr:trypsin-like peptidase domain-containing protein [Clostridia bacterium]
MKCRECGGEAALIGENKYRCPYCACEFEGAPMKEQNTARDPQPQANNGSGGATVFEQNVNGVLEITWYPTPFSKASGSGLLIDSSGYALTNAHVVSDAEGRVVAGQLFIKIAGQDVKAKVVRLGDNKAGSGTGVDLALIKLDHVPMGAKPLTLASFDSVRIGEQVFVIGNSLGDGTCITAGIVSDKQRQIAGHTVLMTDCAINGGNSGGPIFNSTGEVIGVICSSRVKADGEATEGMNYAVPVNIAEDFLKGKHTAIVIGKNMGMDVNYKAASAIAKNPKRP